MLFNYFAGAVFTPQETLEFSIFAFVTAGMLTGLAVFFGKKLFNRAGKKHGLIKAILLGYAFIAAIVLTLFVAPTMIKDNRWEMKQLTCAKQIGYESPADNESNNATGESQAAYRRCLDL